MSVYLGIDIGTSGTKTLAIDAEGRSWPTRRKPILLRPQAAVERAGPDDCGRPRSRVCAAC